MKVFNTLSGKKENLIPIEKNKIKMYVCGMTVYDDTHIGHARTFISFDLIVRYLRSINYEVHYIRNITDVDDKIIEVIAEENTESPLKVEVRQTIEMLKADGLDMTGIMEHPKFLDVSERASVAGIDVWTMVVGMFQ